MNKIVAAFIMVFAYPLHVYAEKTLPFGIIAVPPKPAQPLKLQDMNGKWFILKAQNKWTMVHFWAAWCTPCRKEMPALQKLQKQIDRKRWQLVLVNTADSEDTVFTYLSSLAPDLSSLLDKDGEVTEQWGPRGLPSSYLIDPQGNVRYETFGGLPWHRPLYIDFLHKLSKP